MIAVLDSSVLTSAFLNPTGTPAQLLSCAQRGAFSLCISEHIIGETIRALLRPRIRKSYDHTVEEVERFLDLLIRVADIIYDVPRGNDSPASPDPVSSEQPSLPAVTPKFVLNVSPGLKPYIFTTSPSWADLIEAANNLRQQLGISRPAWIDACQAMGRYQAATAIAVIAAKGEAIRSPGGYLRGMVGRARNGRAPPEQQPLGPRPARASPRNLRCVTAALGAVARCNCSLAGNQTIT